MRILVIGAGGQLAKEIIAQGRLAGHEMVAPAESELDLTRNEVMAAALDKYVPQVVINCAAYNQVDLAESKTDLCMEINGHAVGRLAALCAGRGIFLIHYSSDYVFDGRKEGFYTEEDAVNPLNVYGRSKYLGEQLAREALPGRCLVLRLSWVYGRGSQNFLYKLRGWAEKNPLLRIVYDQVSVPCYTVDIASATYKALAAGLSGLYHLTNSGYCSRYEVARYYFRQLGLDPLVLQVPTSYFPSAAERPLFTAMSNKLLVSKIGAIPDWQDGIERYCRDSL